MPHLRSASTMPPGPFPIRFPQSRCPQCRFPASVKGARLWLRLGLVWAGLALSAAGCASSSLTGRLVDNPLPTAEQQDEVLKLVPVGTPRAEALETLASAGIEVHEGASNTIYYCDIWRRKDGSRWQMDVALLFDKQGNLYRTRSAQALTEVDSAAGLAEPNQPASRSASRGDTSTPSAASSANSLYGVPATPSSAPSPVPAFDPVTDPASSRQRGSAPRVPFDARPPG
jgi:hypothetical protein